MTNNKIQSLTRTIKISCQACAAFFAQASEAKEIGGAIEDGRFDLVLFVYSYVQLVMGKAFLKNVQRTILALRL